MGRNYSQWYCSLFRLILFVSIFVAIVSTRELTDLLSNIWIVRLCGVNVICGVVYLCIIRCSSITTMRHVECNYRNRWYFIFLVYNCFSLDMTLYKLHVSVFVVCFLLFVPRREKWSVCVLMNVSRVDIFFHMLKLLFLFISGYFFRVQSLYHL